MKIGLRPFSSRLSICSLVTSLCTEADSVCSTDAVAVTSTVSTADPTVSVISALKAPLASSLLALLSYFLKPATSTLMA